jgi:hypothetical protein
MSGRETAAVDPWAAARAEGEEGRPSGQTACSTPSPQPLSTPSSGPQDRNDGLDEFLPPVGVQDGYTTWVTINSLLAVKSFPGRA